MSRPPALVLTAGLGTRLRPLTYVRAKAAVPVNGEPLARRVARWLASWGIRDQVYNLHHQPSTIAACLGDGTGLGIKVRYSWEQPVLGSAGGPRHALPLLTDGGAERFLIVNGDTLTDVDLAALLDRHERSGARVTMSLIHNPAPDKYGGVVISPDGYVAAFTRRGTAGDSFHFIGVQVVEADVFAGLTDGEPTESVGGLYPALMRDSPGSVAAFVSEAAFRDIGTPADCLRTSLELANDEGCRLVSVGARIDPSAIVERTAVWDDVTIGPRARLDECIVADGVRIPAGAQYQRCAIVPAGAHAPGDDQRIEHGLLIRAL
jgi:NDP-sugar pyrophosphorylase family protein